MVIAARHARSDSRQRGLLTTDLVVAMGIFLVGIIPLSVSLVSEQKLMRAYYFRAIATEIVDGELERVMAGGAKNLSTGSQSFKPRALAAQNLPPGKFVITRSGKSVRVEWRPENRDRGGHISREATLP
jgi:hypothetical protein